MRNRNTKKEAFKLLNFLINGFICLSVGCMEFKRAKDFGAATNPVVNKQSEKPKVSDSSKENKSNTPQKHDPNHVDPNKGKAPTNPGHSGAAETEIFQPPTFDLQGLGPNKFKIKWTLSSKVLEVQKLEFETQKMTSLSLGSENTSIVQGLRYWEDSEIVAGNSYLYQFFLGTNKKYEQKILVPEDIILTGLSVLTSARTIRAHRIFFESGAEIKTKIHNLNLEAEEIVSDGAHIFTFSEEDRVNINAQELNSARGTNNGRDEIIGSRGIDGRSGGVISIRAKKLRGRIKIIMRGEGGKNGRNALPWDRPAKNGASYSNRAGSHCKEMRQGGNGENGLPGNPGEIGGNGGDSGTLFFEVKDFKPEQLNYKLIGGKKGIGGQGAEGQKAGIGGKSERRLVAEGFGEDAIPNLIECPNLDCKAPPFLSYHECDIRLKDGAPGINGPRGENGQNGKEGQAQLACFILNGKSICTR